MSFFFLTEGGLSLRKKGRREAVYFFLPMDRERRRGGKWGREREKGPGDRLFLYVGRGEGGERYERGEKGRRPRSFSPFHSSPSIGTAGEKEKIKKISLKPKKEGKKKR